MRIIILSSLIGFLFFIGQLITINDYNIMWDGRNHFFKGQAFANFFIYGRHNYQYLPVTKDMVRYYKDYGNRYLPASESIETRLSQNQHYRRSIYQDEIGTFDWLMDHVPTEHPTLSDTGSAVFNIIFFEKLGWLRDDHAYALYGVVLASVLIGIFFYWIYMSYGFFPAVVATITFATTPLFWAESHYNIKDIPLLAFFFIAIWTSYKGFIKHSLKWIILSSVIAGLALGTKFNALFIIPIILSWSFMYLLTQNNVNKKKYGKWWWVIWVYPLIMYGVLVVGWPQLWEDPIGGFLSVINYYKEVGTNIDYTPTFRTLFGFSTYPLFWIIVTTYPLVLGLGIIGIIGWFITFKKTKDYLPLLFILWLFIPVMRASLPNTSIFGGVRHIIEYIPALSFLAGFGAYVLLSIIPSRLRTISSLFLLFLFIPFIITLIKLHPAENVYFNSFIGGLSGAKKANLTGWGNTDGGIYKKAVEWINQNAEKEAHLAVGFSELADFYLPEFRDDLKADNLFSGYLQRGEYIIALTHNSELEHTYRMLYPETFLVPLYEYKVDSVALIKIWKNEKKYLKDDKKYLSEYRKDISSEIKEGKVVWDLGDLKKITRLEFSYTTDKSCRNLSVGYFSLSKNGEDWTILPEEYPSTVIEVLGVQPQKNHFIVPVAGRDARYLSFLIDPQEACFVNVSRSSIVYLE